MRTHLSAIALLIAAAVLPMTAQKEVNAEPLDLNVTTREVVALSTPFANVESTQLRRTVREL